MPLSTVSLTTPVRQVMPTALALKGQSPTLATTPVLTTIATADMPLMVALALAGLASLVVLPMGLSFVANVMEQWRKQKPMTGPMVLHHCRIHDPSYLSNILEAEQVGLAYSNQESNH
jgi:hypothetical protein